MSLSKVSTSKQFLKTVDILIRSINQKRLLWLKKLTLNFTELFKLHTFVHIPEAVD